MKERLKLVKLNQFIPFIVTAVLTAVTMVVYRFVIEPRSAVTYLIMAATIVIPLVFPLCTVVFKKVIPWPICALICLHIMLSNDLGSAMGFYQTFPWWDLFVHGLFGTIASLTAYWLLSGSDKITLAAPYILLLCFCATMALAAVWEIFEFSCDQILGVDAQRVYNKPEGASPVADTMYDIIVAVAGFAVFCALWTVDRFTRLKFMNKLLLRNEEKDEAEN